MTQRHLWQEAYRRTEYRVRLSPAPDLVLRVNRHQPDDDLRLRQECGVHSHWALITPCNPHSQPLDEAANTRRLEELAAMLREQGLARWPSCNRHPQGRWPDEPGYLLCDPPPGLAEALGRRFSQNAIVTGGLGEAAQLLWLID